MQTRQIGIILIIIGVIMMVYTGFTYVTREKVELGPIEVTTKEKHPVQWSPIVGGLLLVGGIVIVATSKKSA